MNEQQDFWKWFSLSYANYLVVPRSVLQAMPLEWQYKMTALLNEMNETLDWTSQHPGNTEYRVHLVECADDPDENDEDDLGRVIDDPLSDYRHSRIYPLVTDMYTILE